MSSNKYYWFEFRCCEGMVKEDSEDRTFVPDMPNYDWPNFRAIGKEKNLVIDELIKKLQSLKQMH